MAVQVPQLYLPQWGESVGNAIGQGLQRRFEMQRQQEQQNRLAQMLPGAMGGDQQALNALAQVSPDAYLKVLGLNQQRDQQTYERTQATQKLSREQFAEIEQRANLALANSANPEQEYGQIRAWTLQQTAADPELQRRIAQALPEQYHPSMLPLAKAGAGIKPEVTKQTTPAAIQEYEYAKAQGYKGSFQDFQLEAKRAGATSVTTYGSPMAAVDAQGNPVLVQSSNRGGVIPVSGFRPAPPAGGRPTEDEAKAAGWFAQAENALANMEAATQEAPGSDVPNVAAEVLGSLPMVGNAARNASLTPGQQRYQQAASSFAEAALRAATGAGVTESEARQKIRELTPQVGDSTDVRKQKAASLRVYLGSLRTRAGRALQPNETPSLDAGNGRPPLSAFER